METPRPFPHCSGYAGLYCIYGLDDYPGPMLGRLVNALIEHDEKITTLQFYGGGWTIDDHSFLPETIANLKNLKTFTVVDLARQEDDRLFALACVEAANNNPSVSKIGLHDFCLCWHC